MLIQLSYIQTNMNVISSYPSQEKTFIAASMLTICFEPIPWGVT